MTRKPNTPRECCRQIQRALVDLADYPNEETPTEFARLVEILAIDDNPGADERWDRAKRALGIFATFAKDAAEAKVDAVDHALELARKGSGDDGDGASLRSVGSGDAA